MKIDYTKFDYMKMYKDSNRNNAKDEIVEAIEHEVIDRMMQTAEIIGNMNIPLNSHATVVKRDEKEIMDKINELLKKEMEYRTKGEFQQQEGSCFDTALKGSKIFLEAQGYVLKRTLNLKK